MSSVNINVVFGNRYNKETPKKKSNSDDICSGGGAEDKCCLGYKELPTGSKRKELCDGSSCGGNLDV